MRRVDTALRQVLAEAVARDLSDPRLGFVTITRVEATQDTREAKVWFSTLQAARAGGEPGGARVGARAAPGARRDGARGRATRRSSPSTTTRPSRTPPRLTRLIDEVTSQADDA